MLTVVLASVWAAAAVNQAGSVTVEPKCPLEVSQPAVRRFFFPFDEAYLYLNVTNKGSSRYVLSADVQLETSRDRSITASSLFPDIILPHSTGRYRGELSAPLTAKVSVVQTYVRCTEMPNFED